MVSISHKGVQSRTFKCLQGQEFEVTCVSAIPNESLALVGFGSSTGSGAVALYNYSTSMILNSWGISHKVCINQIAVLHNNNKLFTAFLTRSHVFVLWTFPTQATSSF